MKGGRGYRGEHGVVRTMGITVGMFSLDLSRRAVS